MLIKIIVCVGIPWGLSGCQSNSAAKERQSKEFIDRIVAESKALEIANCSAPEYELFKSRFYPPFWTVNYQLADERKAYVSLDLNGNFIQADGVSLPNEKNVNQNQNKENLRKEITPTEARTIASVYMRDCADNIQNTYVDYHLAEWKIMLNLKDVPAVSKQWRLANEFFLTITFREDGVVTCPKWLDCQEYFLKTGDIPLFL